MLLLPNWQHVPSEFMFILTFTKLAMGATSVALCDMFGESSYEKIGYINPHPIHMLDEKCNSIDHGNILYLEQFVAWRMEGQF